ncbi:MAG: hypothetical protein WC917_00600 [Bacilli bacterium]|jgi:hypothetical protein
MSTLLETGMISAIGRKEYEKHYKNQKLSYYQAILGHCYSCCCGYQDGKEDCGIKECTLYPFMPYGEIAKNKPKRQNTQKQLENAKRLSTYKKK